MPKKTKHDDSIPHGEDPGQAGTAMAERGIGEPLPPIEDNDGEQVAAGTGDQMVAAAGDKLPGDGGAREEEVAAATAGLYDIADGIALESGPALVAATVETMVEFFRHRPKPWSAMGQAEQRDLMAATEYFAKELVRRVVEEVASDDRTRIRALLESYTEKDGIRVTLKVKPFGEEEALAAVIGLHKAQGKHVLITVASADDYAGVAPADTSEPEQRDLGFESGDHPSDDSDLAAEDLGGGDDRVETEQQPELARTGMQVLVPDHGLRQVRVNLKTSMIEYDGSESESAVIEESDWQDLREATPDELAMERDSLADFDETTESRTEAEATAEV